MCLAWQDGQPDLRGHLNPQHTPTLSTLFIVDFFPGHKMTKIPLNVKFQLNSFLPNVYAQFHYTRSEIKPKWPVLQ